MALQPVTLQLPDRLYRQIRQRAQQQNHSIEDELTAVIESALTMSDDLASVPADIAAEVAQLRFLDNEHLLRAAQRSVSTEQSERMQSLVLKRQFEGVTQAEQQEMEQLTHFANLVMLIRAEAAVLLKERGFDLETLRNSFSPPASQR